MNVFFHHQLFFSFFITESSITTCSFQPEALFKVYCDDLTKKNMSLNPVMMSLFLYFVPSTGALHSACAAEEAEASRS